MIRGIDNKEVFF